MATHAQVPQVINSILCFFGWNTIVCYSSYMTVHLTIIWDYESLKGWFDSKWLQTRNRNNVSFKFLPERLKKCHLHLIPKVRRSTTHSAFLQNKLNFPFWVGPTPGFRHTSTSHSHIIWILVGWYFKLFNSIEYIYMIDIQI